MRARKMEYRADVRYVLHGLWETTAVYVKATSLEEAQKEIVARARELRGEIIGAIEQV